MTARLAKVATVLEDAGEAVVRAGLLVFLAYLGCRVERGGMLTARIGVAPGRQQHLTQAVEHGGLSGQVAGLPAQGQRLLQVAGGLLVPALPQLG